MAAAPLHPPAAGGKTAWGVSEVVSHPADDPTELVKAKRLQADFAHREEERLQRLKYLDSQGEKLLEKRRAMRNSFEMGICTGAEEAKKRHLDALRKMEETKALKKTEKKRKSLDGKERKETKPKRKRKRKPSSSSSSSISSSLSLSSSSSSPQLKKKRISSTNEESRNLEQAAEVARLAREAEERRAAKEQRARDREAKRKAKLAFAALELERRRLEAEAAEQVKEKEKMKAEEDARLKAAELQAAEQAKAKEKAAEEASKNSAEAEAKKALFQSDSLKRRAQEKIVSKAKPRIAGGFRSGDRVVASQDITIKGCVVVMAGTAGTVRGPADSDPAGRVAIDFVKRQDGRLACLNCVPREVRKG